MTLSGYIGTKALIGSGQNRKLNRTEVDFGSGSGSGQEPKTEPNRRYVPKMYLVIVNRRILAHWIRLIETSRMVAVSSL